MLVPPISGQGCRLLYRFLATGNVASFDQANIDPSYAHLMIVCGVRTDQAVIASSAGFQFNGDTGGNYYRQIDRGAVAVASALQNLAATSVALEGTGSTAAAGEVGFSWMLVPVYASAAVKAVMGLTTVFGDTAGASARVDEIHGKWNNTAAITRVTLVPGAGATVLAAGSFMDVYGLV